MAIVEKISRSIYIILFAFYIHWNVMTVIGAVLPQVLADFGWSYLVEVLVIAASSIGYF